MQPRAVGRAISPVVGTALLLAIVVVLGAFAFGAVAFGVSDRLVQPTQADLQAQEDPWGGQGSAVTVTHRGGETIETDDVVVRAIEAGVEQPLSAFTTKETLTAGDRVTIHASEIGVTSDGDRIVVQWQRGGSSTTLASATVAGGSPTVTQTGTPIPTATPTSTPSPTPTSTPSPTASPTPTHSPHCNEDDHDRGHGNDCDGHDEDNPGTRPVLPPNDGGDDGEDECDSEDSETPTQTASPDEATDGCCSADGDHDRGHGNDCDGHDEDNPGNGGGPIPLFGGLLEWAGL
jgi:flagellin-like protein